MYIYIYIESLKIYDERIARRLVFMVKTFHFAIQVSSSNDKIMKKAGRIYRRAVLINYKLS